MARLAKTFPRRSIPGWLCAAAAVSAGAAAPPAPSGLPPYYVPIEIDAAGFERYEKIVEVPIDLTQCLQSLGLSGAVNVASLRLFEVGEAGEAVDPGTPFQFDRSEEFHPARRAAGTLIFLLRGRTAAAGTRRYRLYFGRTGPRYRFVRAAPTVRIEDVGEYEGLPAWKITTPGATYYYHHGCGGFASLVDAGGNDWIGYHPGGGPRGEYRGIPNIAPPQFHPGRPSGKKPGKIVQAGPLRVRLLSETEDGRWVLVWDIYPRYARMTLLRKGPEPYWILYEGTPGGRFEETDYWVDSSGRRFESACCPRGKKWNGRLPAPEWVYFGDPKLDRVLFLALHEHSEAVDEYWHFGDGGMTVFGFGRGPREEGWQRLETVPAHLTIGFVEAAAFAEVSRFVESAWRDVRVRLGRPVQAAGGSVQGRSKE